MSDNALIVFPYFTFFTESALWADLVYGISCNVSLSMCLSVPLCKTNFLRSKKILVKYCVPTNVFFFFVCSLFLFSLVKLKQLSYFYIFDNCKVKPATQAFFKHR